MLPEPRVVAFCPNTCRIADQEISVPSTRRSRPLPTRDRSQPQMNDLRS